MVGAAAGDTGGPLANEVRAVGGRRADGKHEREAVFARIWDKGEGLGLQRTVREPGARERPWLVEQAVRARRM